MRDVNSDMNPASSIPTPSPAGGRAAPTLVPSLLAKRGFSWATFPGTFNLWILLLLITAGGGFLRFWRLDQQSYWFDEGRTIYRICDSFEHLFSSLQNQGFPPGWYVLIRWWAQLMEWWTGSEAQAFAPAYLRLLPALLGTLLVPAMYFLARQFTDRKGALLVALLAAVNPFLIYYSRDLKMYAACYLLVVLHVGLFFQWQTTHRHWLWFPLCTLAGAAMLAMHASAWFIVGLELIWILTRPRLKSLDGPLWVVSVGVMAFIPMWWYLNHSRWMIVAVNTGEMGDMGWNQRYTRMEWETIVSLPLAHLLGYLWPVYPPDSLMENWFGLGGNFSDHLATRSLAWLAEWQKYVAFGLGAVMLLGLVPWRGFRTFAERQSSVTRGRFWWVALWIIIPMVVIACTWIDPDSVWYQRTWGWFGPKFRVQPIWEPRYLGIIVPAWILLLGACLRRLPTWPLRGVLIVGVVTLSTLSALSNHLVYRQAPWSHTAAAFMPYWDAQHPEALAVGTPRTAYPGVGDVYTYQIARGQRPDLTEEEEAALGGAMERRWLRDDNSTGFINAARNNVQVKTIVLTDRQGELTDGSLSNEALAELLGGDWQLVREEKYRWYYEWRFYIYHTWRTRVWVRQSAASQASPSP